ncbi:MAG: hypothetical protein L3J14_03765 [Flavobacteriaceae bacterium]|nr:hypothetical protein [Flavobacteriaceae bacterium]
MGKKNKKNQITVKEEEIDLGKLFTLIGNVFSNLFEFIGRVLKNFFHYFILLLIFIKEHLVKIGIAIILGAIIGYAIDSTVLDKYSYDMIIEPNYGSIDQIFEKMEYYNVLIEEKDSLRLHKEFNISYEEANSLVSFKLEPYETKKDQILAYDTFIKNTDTLTQRNFTFSDFVGDGTSQFDSKRYVYRINSKINNLTLFGDKILADIEKNPTIQKKKRIQLYTLKLDSIAARVALREIDSLRSIYKKVTLSELEKEITPNSSSTYLDFSKESKSNNNDIALFNISKDLNKKLIEIEKAKETSLDVVNVITTFNPVGSNRGKISDTYKFILTYLFGGGMLAFLLLKRLNNYLNHYKNKNIQL